MTKNTKNWLKAIGYMTAFVVSAFLLFLVVAFLCKVVTPAMFFLILLLGFITYVTYSIKSYLDDFGDK